MEAVIRLMKEKGQRFTSQKKEVLQVLKQEPQTVLEILTALKQKKYSIDKATIYRILTSFVKLNIVKDIHFGDKEVRYELVGDGHHHHLVCESCGDIKDIEVCEEILLKDVQRQTSFQVKSHSLEFFGTCKKCQ